MRFEAMMEEFLKMKTMVEELYCKVGGAETSLKVEGEGRGEKPPEPPSSHDNHHHILITTNILLIRRSLLILMICLY
jgi:hypothetical protein